MKKGLCIYLTGRSGSGKTTIAHKLKSKLLINESRKISILDGDEIRQLISSELTLSIRHRSLNVRRIGYIANLITYHGGISICSNISPYKIDRDYNRQRILNNGHYVEIFINSTLKDLIQRDPKGLYYYNYNNIIESYDQYEVPENHELTVDTHLERIDESVDKIYTYLENNNYLQSK
jgi:adenylyl-sulfate kinase